jgi:hypothetical protein
VSAMFTVPQLDPSGAIIIEAREDPDVAALVDERVRGPEPAKDDARGAGQYQAFVTIACLSAPPEFGVPTTFAEYALNAYGSTYQNAWAVWAALVKAFHKVGPRVKANGLAIYQTLVLTGGTEDSDPITKQPVVRGTLRVIASTLAVETAGS